MGLSVSDKLAFIREYKRQGGKGNYLSAIKEYELGGKIPPHGTLNAPISTPDREILFEPPPAKKLSPKEFLSEYAKSPKYTERLTNMGYMFPKEVVKDRQQILKESKITSTTEGSYYDPIERKAFVDKKDAIKMNTGVEDIEVHELSHGAGALAKKEYFNPQYYGLNPIEEQAINSRNNLYPYLTNYISGKVPYDATKLHDAAPTEFKADMNVLRYKLFNDGIYNAGTEDFTKDILNKAKLKYTGTKEIYRFSNWTTEEDLIWLMNNIAQHKNTTDETKEINNEW